MKRRIFFLPYERLHCIFSTAWTWDTVGGRQGRAITFVGIRLMDTLTPTERSKRMALIRGKNTKPELAVRKIARSFGHRLRSRVTDLPGKPDLVFPGLRKVTSFTVAIGTVIRDVHPQGHQNRSCILDSYMDDSEISVHCCEVNGLGEP